MKLWCSVGWKAMVVFSLWFSLIIGQKSYSKTVYLPPSIWKWFKWDHWQARQLHNFPLSVELQILSFRNKISSSPRWLRRRITLPSLISWWKLPNTHMSSLITSRTNIFTYFFIHEGLRGCFLSFCGWACGSKTITDEGLTCESDF